MATPQKTAAQTRWLYRVEARALRYNKFANQDRSIDFLRDFAEKVWKKESRGRRMPVIKATNGLKYGGTLTSFCLGFTHIELARHHRNVLVLLHELTHAMGPCLHGPKFIKVYFPLLWKYGGFNRVFIESIAAERNVVLL